LLLRALLQQIGNKLALVFDNLETLQDPTMGRITDDAVAAWLEACKPVGADPTPVVLVTSRWMIPGWEGDRRVQRPLGAPLYGDFLRYHQQLGGAAWGAERLRRLYEALGGNFKGLEFFHALSQVAGDDEAFLQRLEQSRKELQLYMAVEKLVDYLLPAERELLNRLRAYLAPTFADGVRIVAQGLAEPERLLRRLVGLSLVEVQMEPESSSPRYRLAPVVSDWLKQHEPEPASEIRQRAAKYQLWVFNHRRTNQDQALIAHEALQQSGLDEEAARFALSVIVPAFERIGLYQTLLKDWLPALRESRDQALQVLAMNYSGGSYLRVGQYDEALRFFEKSLAICRAIGDRAGESATLNNLSGFYRARGDYDAARRYLEESLAICRAIGDRAGEGVTLNNISRIYRVRGDDDMALRSLEESLAIHQDIGDRAEEGTNLNNISQIYQARGDYDTALGYLEESLAIRQAIDDRAGEGVTLSNISQIYQARGDDDTALRYLEKSLAILRAIDDRAGLCVTLFNIGHIYLDPQQARACLVEAYRIAKEIGHAPILAALENLAKQAGKGLELWEQLSQKWGSGNNPRRANQ
jgi:tetratricopeptide (TPR) repeat protein